MDTTHLPRLYVCLAARSGPMRNALLSFLRSMPEVKVALLVEDPSRAVQFIRQHIPDVVIIEATNSTRDWLSLIENLRKELSGVRVLVLIDTLEQQQIAFTAGASQVIFKGMPGEWVKQAIWGKNVPNFANRAEISSYPPHS